jgi:hypothetical protein
MIYATLARHPGASGAIPGALHNGRGTSGATAGALHKPADGKRSNFAFVVHRQGIRAQPDRGQ